MHFRRVSAKRKLLLLPVHSASQTPAMSFRAPTVNAGQREQLWFESIVRSHDSYCGCGDTVTHFNNIATRFNYLPLTSSPLDPSSGPPRGRPAIRALPAPPAAPSTPTTSRPWRGGADGEGGRGAGGGDGGAAVEGDYQQEELDELFAALEDDQERR